MRKKKHAPPFFRATSGVARFGKQFGCGHTPKFSQAAGPQKCLLGSSPNPLNFWTLCPEVPAQAPVVGGPSLSFLGLILTLVCYAEQMINVRLYRHGLPHLPLGIPVFCIKLFLLSRQLTAGCSSAS